MASSISESREVGERPEFHVLPRKSGSGAMNELEHCHDPTASFSQSRDLVFSAEQHHRVGKNLVDRTLLSLFVHPVRIRNA